MSLLGFFIGLPVAYHYGSLWALLAWVAVTFTFCGEMQNHTGQLQRIANNLRRQELRRMEARERLAEKIEIDKQQAPYRRLVEQARRRVERTIARDKEK